MVPALSLVFPFVVLQVVSIGRLLGSHGVWLGINLVTLLGYDLTREKVLHLGPWKVGATLLDNRLSSNYTLCPYNSPNYHSQCSTDSYRLYSRVVPLLTSLASVTDDGLSANLLVFRRNKSFTTTLEKLSNSSQNWTFSSFCLFVFYIVKYAQNQSF